MGKARTKKYRCRRHNPCGLPLIPDVKEGGELLGEDVTSSDVRDLLDMLQGGNAEQRECAACIMSNFAKDPATCESLLTASVIRTAAPLLLDNNCAVRHSIAGALRNISAIDHKACQALILFDIMTPLTGLLKEYNSPWQPAASQEKIDSKTEVFYEAVNLLWNLCESHKTPMTVFNREKLWTVLLPCLNVDKYGTKIAIAVGHCLHAVSENNAELAENMSFFTASSGIFQTLFQEPGMALIQVLSAGILINITEAQKAPMAPILLPVISVLDNALCLPVLTNMNMLAANVAELEKPVEEKNMDTDMIEEKEKDHEKILTSVLDGLMAKKTAVELFSDLCFEEDDGNGDDDYEDISDDSTASNGDMEAEETSVTFPLKISSEFHDALMRQNIFPKVLDHASQLDEALANVFLKHKPSSVVLKRVRLVRCGALVCIANLVEALDPDDLGGISGLASIWICLGQLTFSHMDSQDYQLLEASTGACRAVLQALASAAAQGGPRDTPPLPSLNDEDLKVLAQGCHCYEPAVRTNMARVMSALGCLLGPYEPNVLKKVGLCLMEVAFKDPDVSVVAEAVDGLLDAFAEDTTQAVAVEIELVTKLRLFLPAFRSKVKLARRILGSTAHFPVIATAKDNLVRFLKYKAQKSGIPNGNPNGKEDDSD